MVRELSLDDLIALSIFDKQVKRDTAKGAPMTGGFRVDDRRRISALPVKDAQAAQEMATRPIADIDNTAPALVPEPKEKQFDLSPLRLVFGEYLRHHANARESKGFMDQFKKLLPGVTGSASLLVMGNLPVATYRHDGKLAVKKLADEQPEIVKKYTRLVTKEEFDEEAFRRDEPLLHQAYRGRSLRLVTSGAGAGLVLPGA